MLFQVLDWKQNPFREERHAPIFNKEYIYL